MLKSMKDLFKNCSVCFSCTSRHSGRCFKFRSQVLIHCEGGPCKSHISLIFFYIPHTLVETQLKSFYIWILRKSQIEKIKAKEGETMKKSLDTSETGVFGWELLEAEETLSEKQAKKVLSAKTEETSGLVKAIVDVFHKG